LSSDTAQRLADLYRFYDLMQSLEERLGGKRLLSECSGRMSWPRRGVYFFFEPGEERSHFGHGPRVVRVGTHALTATSRTSLWHRLSQHRGTSKGGGNHRGSIFRLLVGAALATRYAQDVPVTWGRGNSAEPGVRDMEREHEERVSAYIGAMPFLWLDVEDAAGPVSPRGLLERNSIALLSNYSRTPLDPASAGWLGQYSDRERVRQSGLWNQNHVDEEYVSDFLEVLQHLILHHRPQR
jgi:hypothetical protein